METSEAPTSVAGDQAEIDEFLSRKITIFVDDRSNDQWPKSKESEQPLIDTGIESNPPWLSIETPQDFGPDKYQQMVTSMVSELSATFRDSLVPEAALVKVSALLDEGENMTPCISQDSSWRESESKENVQIQSGLVHRRALPALCASRFSISSVDPLHFLGITPTVQSAELFHGCKQKNVEPMK